MGTVISSEFQISEVDLNLEGSVKPQGGETTIGNKMQKENNKLQITMQVTETKRKSSKAEKHNTIKNWYIASLV